MAVVVVVVVVVGGAVVVGASVVGAEVVGVVVVGGTVLGVLVIVMVVEVVSPVGVLLVPPAYRTRAVIPKAVTQMIATTATQALGDSEPLLGPFS